MCGRARPRAPLLNLLQLFVVQAALWHRCVRAFEALAMKRCGVVKARTCATQPSARLEFHGTNSMPLGQLGKVEASKPCTKAYQQPWSDVFEGVEGGRGTRPDATGLESYSL